MIHISLDKFQSIQDLISDNGKLYLFLDATIPEDFFPLFEAYGTHIYYKERFFCLFTN